MIFLFLSVIHFTYGLVERNKSKGESNNKLKFSNGNTYTSIQILEYMHQFRITNVQGDIGQNRGKFKVLWSMSHKSVYSFMNLNTVNINFKKFSTQRSLKITILIPLQTKATILVQTPQQTRLTLNFCSPTI